MAEGNGSTNTTPIGVDEEYKNAIQPVIDDRMRTDVLGPYFCNVLKNHTPARTDVVKLISDAIGSDPELKKATKAVIEEHNKETKMKWVDRALGAAGTIVITLVIWGVQYLVTH